jgi:hypothetical protein
VRFAISEVLSGGLSNFSNQGNSADYYLTSAIEGMSRRKLRAMTPAVPSTENARATASDGSIRTSWVSRRGAIVASEGYSGNAYAIRQIAARADWD